MNTGFEPLPPATAPRVWPVGALTRAVASALEARFNPVSVRGEVSGFTRAGSGHCYFALKDADMGIAMGSGSPATRAVAQPTSY